jgi:hypothetical protein
VTQPPIVPGYPEPQQSGGWQASPGPSGSLYIAPPPPPRRRASWVLPAQIGAAGIVVLAALVVAALLVFPRFSRPARALGLPPAQTALRSAYIACGKVGDLTDDDRTLFLDMRGEKAGSGDLSAVQIDCYFQELKMPDYIIREMGQTTALNGRQSDTWSDFSASWTYHPDNGLDVLIRQVKG